MPYSHQAHTNLKSILDVPRGPTMSILVDGVIGTYVKSLSLTYLYDPTEGDGQMVPELVNGL